MANWGNEISGKFPRLSTSFNSSGWYHWLYHANHPSQCDHFWVDQCDVQNYSHNGLDYEKKPLKKWFGTRRGGTTRQKTQLASDQIPPPVGCVQTWGTTQLMASSMVKNGTMIINHQVFRISVDRDRPSWFHGLCRLTWTHLASSACN